jgi:SPP1 gp7 family putative phage head morphogenesis protein
VARGLLIAPAAATRRVGGPTSPLVQQMLDHQAAQIEHLVASELAALTPLLEQARKSLAADLLKAWHDKPADQNFEKQHLSNALVMVDAAIKKMRGIRGADPFGGSLNQVLAAAGGGSMRLSARHLNDQLARFSEWFEGTIHPVQIQEAAVIAAGAKALIPRFTSSAARYSANVQADIKREIAIAFLRNETFDQMTARLVAHGGPKGLVALRGVAGTPGTKVELITEGLFKRYRYWAERIVRTEANNAYNVVHKRGIAEAAEDDPDIKERWDAASDWRVCIICRDLDGKIVDVGGVFPGGYSHPPAHPHDRCTVVPWKPQWERGYVGHPVQEVPADQAAAPTPVDPRRRELYQIPTVPQRAPDVLPGRLPTEAAPAPIAPPKPPKPIALSEPEAAQILGPSLKPAVADAEKAAAAAIGQMKAEMEKLAARLRELEKHQAELAALPPKKMQAIVAKGRTLFETQAAKAAQKAAEAQAKEEAKKAAAAAKQAAKEAAAKAKAQAAALKSLPTEPLIAFHVPSDFEALAADVAKQKKLAIGELTPADLWKSLDAQGVSVTPSQSIAYLKQLAAEEAHSSALTKWEAQHGHLFPADQAHPVIQAMNAKSEAKAALAKAAAEKAKQEAEAKAAAEAKAKKEAIAKKSAETKAKNKAAKEAAAQAEAKAAAVKATPLPPKPTAQIKGWTWGTSGNQWVLIDEKTGKSAQELAQASHATPKTLEHSYTLGQHLASEGLYPVGNGVMEGHGLKYEKNPSTGNWDLTGKLGKDGAWQAVEKPKAPPKPTYAHGYNVVGVPSASGHPQPGAVSTAPAKGAPELSRAQFGNLRERFSGDISSKERSAALAYSGSSYREINSTLRASKGAQVASSHRDTVEHLDAAIARTRMVQDTRVFRGCGGAEAAAYFRQFTPGDIFQEHGYTSTSFNYEASLKTSTRLEITVPKNGLGAAIPSHFQSEDELLLPRGQKFRVDRLEQRGGELIVHVTAVYGDDHALAPEKVSR